MMKYMLSMIQKHPVWNYCSLTQRDLINEGKFLTEIIQPHRFKDYSFLVFPFAKAYEGFLKQLFLDVGFISHMDYISDHFRVGKYLSPNMIQRIHEKSVYLAIRKASSEDMATNIWKIWKDCRNEVIHYYPHNLKRISFAEAVAMDEDILQTMIRSYEELKLHNNKK